MNTIILIPTNPERNLSNIILGLVHSLERQKKKIYLFEPIFKKIEEKNNDVEKLIKITSKKCIYQRSKKKNVERSEFFEKEKVLEEIIDYYNLIRLKEDIDKIYLIKGNCISNEYHSNMFINYEIMNSISAKIVFIASEDTDYHQSILKYIQFLKISRKNVLGIIFSNVSDYLDEHPKKTFLNFSYKENLNKKHFNSKKRNFKAFSNIEMIKIPWNFNLMSIRSIDISRYLKSNILNRGEIETKRINSILFGTKKLFDHFNNIPEKSLIISSSKDLQTIISTYLSILNERLKISTLLIVDGLDIDRTLYNCLHRLFYNTHLPVLIVEENLFETSVKIQKINPLNLMIQYQDVQKIKKIRNYISTHLEGSWIKSLFIEEKKSISNFFLECRGENISAAMFRYKLIYLAKQKRKTIILPEGETFKMIRAASICKKKGISNCILLGNPKKVKKIADQFEISLKDIEILDPKTIYHRYIDQLVILRKKKGMNRESASSQLKKNNILLATMMLQQDEVDGLVSGIVNTTADTIRPALQLIKTNSISSIISSIFFMLFPKKTLIFGDCAINIDPNSEELSEIAIQSAESAMHFGIIPKIAMISYSTGNSAYGDSVEKVKSAVKIIKRKKPELLVDGPIQYDAAISEEVSKKKFPNSNLSGKATVFIFPNLDTGNAVYKAVQRAANLTSVGPILQGIRKPVNDLSRGASIEDIIYTIAATSIQSR
ncbi:phosphate acetyltransferase [Candidatus Riesia pediculicola]|uniref:phosphate acetyltransferase n=1 Tax=Candidatus Riesia pediculicola TaxID=401619 RepID=UPI00178C84C3|nr:phosphate acetyltransferase [Candidatus Riesia pediculicola]QOJ86582.1 phosphate acetyltransferase [Candidatus Riesia pediculicola]